MFHVEHRTDQCQGATGGQVVPWVLTLGLAERLSIALRTGGGIRAGIAMTRVIIGCK